MDLPDVVIGRPESRAAATDGTGPLRRTGVAGFRQAGLREAGHEGRSLDLVAHEDVPSIVLDLSDGDATSGVLQGFRRAVGR